MDHLEWDPAMEEASPRGKAARVYSLTPLPLHILSPLCVDGWECGPQLPAPAASAMLPLPVWTFPLELEAH